MHNTQHHHLIDKLGTLNALAGAFALYPQLYNMYTQPQNYTHVSPISFYLIAINCAIWILYGAHCRMKPLIISSTITGIAALGIIIMISV